MDCPKCKKPCVGPLAGIVVYPNDTATHGSMFHVCWDCKMARPTTPMWMSMEREAKRERSKTEWMKHTPYHWQTKVLGETLDYWPTKRKWRYRGETLTGDVKKFIRQELNQ